MQKIRSYKELDVWQKGIEIADAVYEATQGFPSEERYGLVAQMIRAAVSIPSNIAEGVARQHKGEYRQFCFIALGSCAELETQLIIARRRDYLSESEFAELEEHLDHEGRILTNLTRSLSS